MNQEEQHIVYGVFCTAHSTVKKFYLKTLYIFFARYFFAPFTAYIVPFRSFAYVQCDLNPIFVECV